MDLAQFISDFHSAHESIFAFRDEISAVEMVGWTGKVRCRLRTTEIGRLEASADESELAGSRKAYFGSGARTPGNTDVALQRFEGLETGVKLPGPAIIESPFTTIVVDHDATFLRTVAGSLIIELGNAEAS